jgi:hypothetical protein
VGLIKDQNAVIDEISIPFEKPYIQQVVIGHEEQIAVVFHVEGIEVGTETSLPLLLEILQLHNLIMVLLAVLYSLVSLLEMRTHSIAQFNDLFLLIRGILIHLLQLEVSTPRFIALLNQIMALELPIIHPVIDAGMLPRAHYSHRWTIARLLQLLHHLLQLGVSPR